MVGGAGKAALSEGQGSRPACVCWGQHGTLPGESPGKGNTLHPGGSAALHLDSRGMLLGPQRQVSAPVVWSIPGEMRRGCRKWPSSLGPALPLNPSEARLPGSLPNSAEHPGEEADAHPDPS